MRDLVTGEIGNTAGDRSVLVGIVKKSELAFEADADPGEWLQWWW